MFGKKLPHHLVPIDPDNVANNDWVILLEASTIIGPAQERTWQDNFSSESAVQMIRAW